MRFWRWFRPKPVLNPHGEPILFLSEGDVERIARRVFEEIRNEQKQRVVSEPRRAS